MVQTLTQALAGLLPALQGQGQPQGVGGAGGPMGGIQADNVAGLLQLGMGLGMSLQAQGLLNQPSVDSSASLVDQQTAFTGDMDLATAGLQPGSQAGGVGMEAGDGGSVMSGVMSIASLGTPQVQSPGPFGSQAGGQASMQGSSHTHRQPIGVADPTTSGRTAYLLDHRGEEAQRAGLAAQPGELSTQEQYRGVSVVPNETPDEHVDEMDEVESREEKAKRLVPVFAYPPELLGKDFATHGVAGAGTSFVLEEDAQDQHYVEGSKKTLRRRGDVLPEGFFTSIHATHTAQAEVDYLPTVPNLPQPRPVGRVKPRSAAEDWFALGFDPWSAGKDPLSREFIPSLNTKEESLLEQSRKNADEAFIQVLDKEGMRRMEAEASQAHKLTEMFNELASWARHGKYREIEDAMNQPDYNLPVDFQDDLGNTLLHIAVQNGNKRIAKLCLRRGADINRQNLTGQTVLHYAYSYGFTELFQYLMSKGASDSLRNADGLTCYEGLDMNDVQQL